MNDTKRRTIRDISIYVIWTALCVYVCFFVLSFCKAASGSMAPTLMTGEYFIINRAAYTFSPVKTGDIVSFKRITPETGEEENYTKRVVGVGGDTITFKDGDVYLNGTKLDESAYLNEHIKTFCDKTFEVPDGYMFVMGDNRLVSSDSREWEQPYISTDKINGKLLIGLPFLTHHSDIVPGWNGNTR